MEDVVTEHWVDKFRNAPREKRTLVCEALAWKIKVGAEEWKQKFKKLADSDDAMEDLIVGLFVAFVPPSVRELALGKLVPLITHLQEAADEGDDDENKAKHDALRRALDRIAGSTYVDDPDRPHAFADVDLTNMLLRFGHMTEATKKLVECDVKDEETFRKRWQLENHEWLMISQESVQAATDEEASPMSAAEVSEEQRRRMRTRGQTSVLDGLFARHLLNRLYGEKPASADAPDAPAPAP